MKTIKLLALGLATSALMFTACKKEDKTTETTSKSTLLTGKDWRMIGLTLTSPSGTVDIYATMDACDKDDLEEFLAAGTVVSKPGATKCDPAEPDSSPGGNWAFLNNESQLRVIDGDTTLMDITELTATSLKLKITEVDAGITYYTNLTMTKN